LRDAVAVPGPTTESTTQGAGTARLLVDLVAAEAAYGTFSFEVSGELAVSDGSNESRGTAGSREVRFTHRPCGSVSGAAARGSRSLLVDGSNKHGDRSASGAIRSIDRPGDGSARGLSARRSQRPARASRSGAMDSMA
jgi:hypothetical protein